MRVKYVTSLLHKKSHLFFIFCNVIIICLDQSPKCRPAALENVGVVLVASAAPAAQGPSLVLV